MLKFSVAGEGVSQCINVDHNGETHSIPIPSEVLPADPQEQFTFLTKKMMDAGVVPAASFVLNL